MALHSASIEIYGKLSNGNYSTTAKKTFVPNNLDFNYSIQTRADRFTIAFNLNSLSDFKIISIDDDIKLYAIIDGVSTLLVDGIIQKIKVENKTDREIIILDCMNRLEKMFNGLVATTGETVQKTATQWLRDVILKQVNDFNKRQQITWHPSNGETTKLIPFTRGHTPAIELMKELTRPEFTGTSNYIFYLTNDNYLVYKKRPTSVSSTITLGKNTLNMITEKALWELVNYIILNCGKNLYGTASILELGYNVESISDYGWKMKVVLSADISDKLKTAEWAKQRSQGISQEGTLFPSSYPYTTTWGDTVNSDSEYNASFIEEVRVQGKTKINSLLKDLGSATYKSTIEIIPSFGYVPGNLYKIVNTKIGWSSASGTLLRLEGIQYAFSKNGWTVDLSFKEDEDENVVY